MTKEISIEEGNRLIAEFMGFTVYPEQGDNEYKKWKGERHDYHVFELKYHSSWDWLIPVCYKIDKAPIIKIQRNGVESVMPQIEQMRLMKRGAIKFDIGMTWQGCVKFIQWYNSNQSK
jgi:hypothetical protein